MSSSVGCTTYCCSRTVSSKVRDFARYPVSLVVMIAFEGFVVRIPCLFRNLSIYAIGGSLFLIGWVQSFLDDTSMIVRNPIYPSQLFFTIGLGVIFDPFSRSKLDGPLTNAKSM
jgi:hypothetical protein